MFIKEQIKRKFRYLFNRPKKVGLALGGGSSRFAAHAGVLKVLIENRIPIDYLAGTSSGAIIGAFYAGGVNIYDILMESKRTDMMRVAGFKFKDVLPMPGLGMEDFIKKHVGDKNIEDLRIPYIIVATDIKSGDKVLIRKGNLARAVHASSAIPGIFDPVEIKGRTLVDGLIVDNVPAQVVRDMGADYVIAVDVVPDVKLTEPPKNIRDIVERSVDIASRRQSQKLCDSADIIINPVKKNISPMDFSRGEELIKAGEQAALKIIGRIKKDLRIK